MQVVREGRLCGVRSSPWYGMASWAMKFEYAVGKLWCLVTQPDACCFSLKLREDAKGQCLLDEVSGICTLLCKVKVHYERKLEEYQVS